MMLLDNLLDILDSQGVILPDRKDFKKELQECLEKDNFRFIHNGEGKEIGFYSWMEVFKNGKLNIYVNSLIILKDYRNKYNLLKVKSYLRELYPRADLIYWHRERNGFHYSRRKQ